MSTHRSWVQIAPTYRSHEVKIIVDWIIGGVSGTVVGLPGVGKSNFLGFLCYRPDVIRPMLAAHDVEATLIPIDLNNLPDDSNATFYRVILRSFYENCEHIDPSLKQVINSIYRENKAARDPFLAQSGLRELLTQFRAQHHRVCFVFDRFDLFCETERPHMTDALRGLRDSFKDMLFYVMGMRQEAAYLSNPSALGELYEILDTRVCWLGPFNEADARTAIMQETRFAKFPLSEEMIVLILHLSGGIPALLKAICSWWMTAGHDMVPDSWHDALLQQPTIRYRLEEILAGLSQEEQFTLSEWQQLVEAYSVLGQQVPSVNRVEQDALRAFEKTYVFLMNRLCEKGIVERNTAVWTFSSKLLASFLREMKGYGLGKIWLDEETSDVYQGRRRIEKLSPLEKSILQYLVKFPRIQHTKTDLMAHGWPDDVVEEVTDGSLYRVISDLRKKIEPIPSKPCYLLNWRGIPEGGYQLFPEGRPR